MTRSTCGSLKNEPVVLRMVDLNVPDPSGMMLHRTLPAQHTICKDNLVGNELKQHMVRRKALNLKQRVLPSNVSLKERHKLGFVMQSLICCSRTGGALL